MLFQPSRIISAGIIVLSLILGGCGGSQGTEEIPEAFVFGRGADAQKLDPADISDGESVNTLAQIMEGLLGFREGSLELEGRLAKSWEVSEDGLSITFQLREGVVFHDGTVLNAETARFTFDRQMDPAHPASFEQSSFQYWQNLFWPIERIETVDPMTLRFHLSEPNAGILTAFATFPVWLVSPGALERFGDQMVFHPVGTGPYEFVSWRPNEAILLKRFANYWGKPAGFERLVIRSIPSNTSRLSELLAGNLHGLDGLQPAELEQLREKPEFTVLHQAGLNVGYLAFSDLSEKVAEIQLRKAVAMAIDREAIVRLALDAYGAVADWPMPDGFLGEPDKPGPIEFNPEEAKALVDANPHWKERVIELATFGQPRAYFPDPQRVASLIRSDLEKAGFQVSIVNREFKSHLHTTRRGEFDMALLGWIADTPDPDNFLRTFFHSDSARLGSATNISFYKNPEMDEALDAAVRMVDPEERAVVYEQALDLWAADLPLLPLVHGEQIVVMDGNIRGYELSPTGNHFFGPARWAAGSDDAE